MSPSTLSLRAGPFSLLCGLAVVPAAAQGPPPLRLDGLTSGGTRASVTEAWGTFNFSVTNLSDQDRRARVLLSYEVGPDAPQDRTQYGRDVWVPARSTLSSWLPPGRPPVQKSDNTRMLQLLLYDRTGGGEQWVRPPGEERIRSRGAPSPRIVYNPLPGRGSGPRLCALSDCCGCCMASEGIWCW